MSAFCQKDRLYSPVDPILASNMRLAYSQYKEKQEINRDELAKRREGYHIKKDGKTKCKVVEENRTSVDDARQKHVQVLEKVYGARRLISETSSRASVSTTTATVVSAISTTTISTSTNLMKSLNRKRSCVQSKLDELFAPVAKK